MTYDTYFRGRPHTVGLLLTSNGLANGEVVGELIVGSSEVSSEGRMGVSRGLERDDEGLDAGASSSSVTKEAVLARRVGYGLW